MKKFPLGKETFTLGDSGQDYVFTNHGSYGATPRSVTKFRNDLLLEVERNPDLWFRETASVKLAKAIQAVSSFVHCHPKDLAFVVNATEAFNTLICSLENEGLFTATTGVLVLDLAYGAIQNTLVKLCERTQCDLVEVKVPLPLLSVQAIIRAVEHRLDEYNRRNHGRKIKVAVFDHITSQTALVLPIKKLVQLCHERNIRNTSFLSPPFSNRVVLFVCSLLNLYFIVDSEKHSMFH